MLDKQITFIGPGVMAEAMLAGLCWAAHQVGDFPDTNGRYIGAND
ncbi:MAG: hypothetical protein ACM3QS_16295 [Bacteroidota bacterium]